MLDRYQTLLRLGHCKECLAAHANLHHTISKQSPPLNSPPLPCATPVQNAALNTAHMYPSKSKNHPHKCTSMPNSSYPPLPLLRHYHSTSRQHFIYNSSLPAFALPLPDFGGYVLPFFSIVGPHVQRSATGTLSRTEGI